MKYQVGVIGSSNPETSGGEKAFTIGQELAKSKCSVLTGGCTGLPYKAIEGAKEENGHTVGVSPAENEKEHLKKYQYPVEKHDVLIYTGFGFKGRNVILVRSSDAVIATAGSMGTLNELTNAYGQKKVIGLLKGAPGAAGQFEKLANKIGRPGREIVSDRDPEKLVKKVLEKLENE